MKALIAELIVGLLARVVELPVPDVALIEVPSSFGRAEPEHEGLCDRPQTALDDLFDSVVARHDR